jgi:Catalytic LigB subunit of aromatic ring-opening dioxygenase
MSHLTAAFGTSHSTMLLSPVEHWLLMFDHVDRKAPIRDFEGENRSFDELLQRLPADAAARIAPAAIAERHRRTAAAMDRLEADIRAAKLDALIVIGDDQREIFRDDSRPAIGVYYGPTIRNAAAPSPPPDDWYLRDQSRRLEDKADAHYPVHVELATHMIETLTARGFDIAAVKSLPVDRYEGHAYSFIHRRYLAASPVPIVPVFLNTYYPPNQPTPARCADLGAALRVAIAAFPGAARVGIMASGGLSHFLVNEPLDDAVLRAIRARDVAALSALPPRLLQSGSSEIRNWICVTAAAIDLRLEWLEYVPAYRSRALTGVGLCFARWS